MLFVPHWTSRVAKHTGPGYTLPLWRAGTRSRPVYCLSQPVNEEHKKRSINRWEGRASRGREGDWRKQMIKMLSRKSCSTKRYFSSLDIVNSCGFSKLKHKQRNNVIASFRNSKFYASEVEPIVRRYEKLSTLKVSLNWSTCLGKTVDTLFWLSVMQSVATGHCAAWKWMVCPLTTYSLELMSEKGSG